MGGVRQWLAAPARLPFRRSLTAAGQRIAVGDRASAERLRRGRPTFQEEAWDYFREIGEVRVAYEFAAMVAGACVYFPAVSLDPRQPPVAASEPEAGIPDALAADAAAALRALQPDPTGDFWRRYALLFGVPGECYLTGVPSDTGDRWSVRSTFEVQPDPSGWQWRDRPSDMWEQVPETVFVSRLWWPHAQFFDLPTSMMEGILGPCQALMLLDRRVRAQLRAGMAAGIVKVPSDMLGDTSGDPAREKAAQQRFMEEIFESVYAPVDDESAPGYGFVFGPGDKLDQLGLLKLLEKLDPEMAAERTALIKRVAQGLPIPPEKITGLGDANHWSGWAIDEDAVRQAEGLIRQMCGAITTGYLRPWLLDSGHDPAVVERLFVWYDPAEAVSKPDLTDAAFKAHDALAISDEALLRYTGLNPADRPTDEEIARRLGAKRGILTADLTEALLRLLDAPVQWPPPDAIDGEVVDAPAEETPDDTPTSDTIPDTAPPGVTAAATPDLGMRLAEVDTALRARLQGVLDAELARVLERAGARARTAALRASGPGSRAAREQALTAALDGVDRTHVAARVLGLTAAVSEAELLDGAFADLAPTVDRILAAGQASALALAGLDADRLADVAAAQEEDRADAVAWLLGALAALAASRLRAPDPAAPDVGEFDATAGVPHGIVRETVARAGGSGSALATPGEPAGGVATGPRLREALARSGWRTTGYRWVHGAFGRTQPFPPHAALDGVEFADFTDPRLANRGSFPRASFFAPGDHEGCACSFAPVLTPPVA